MTVNLPKTPRPGSPLTLLVGQEAAQAVVDAVGWGKVTIPQGEFRGAGARRADIKRRLRAGESVNDIVRATGAHESSIWRIKRSMRNDAKQHTLPGLDLPTVL